MRFVCWMEGVYSRLFGNLVDLTRLSPAVRGSDKYFLWEHLQLYIFGFDARAWKSCIQDGLKPDMYVIQLIFQTLSNNYAGIVC